MQQKPVFPKNLSFDDLVAQLHDPDPKNRRGAAYVLATKGGANVYAVLVAQLTDDDSAVVRRWIADALGRLGDADALPALETAVAHDPDPDVQMAAATAIGTLDRRANSALVAALHATSFRVQAAAATALEKIGDASVIPTLVAWLTQNEGARAHYEAGLRAMLDEQPEKRGGVEAYELMLSKREAEVTRTQAEQAVTNALVALRAKPYIKYG